MMTKELIPALSPAQVLSAMGVETTG